MRRTAFILAVALLASGAGGEARTDRQHYETIKKRAQERNSAAAKKESAAFFKTHPDSRLVPDVRLILADLEPSPDEATALYRTVVTRYPHFEKRPYAQYRVCEIAFLQSKWELLEREAREGLKLGATPYGGKFGFFLAMARIHGGDYAGAEQECRRLIETDHEYRSMARSLLVLSQVLRATTGFSRDYIGTLKDIAAGYGDSDAMPAALYFLGEFYESKRLYNEAYSAYTDLVSRYVGSPEAAEASRRLNAIMKNNPRRVFYLPGKKILDATDRIDIHPETDVPEQDKAAVFYAISVGPLDSAKKAAELKTLLRDFDSVRSVRLKNGYAIHVGRGGDEAAALKLKIRLAEEYGINGRIIRVSGVSGRSYIYGE